MPINPGSPITVPAPFAEPWQRARDAAWRLVVAFHDARDRPTMTPLDPAKAEADAQETYGELGTLADLLRDHHAPHEALGDERLLDFDADRLSDYNETTARAELAGRNGDCTATTC